MGLSGRGGPARKRDGWHMRCEHGQVPAMDPRIVVLGAGGGFGGAVARAVHAAGFPLRCALRDPARAPLLPGAEILACDAQDRADLARAVADRDVVVHAVGYPFAQWDPAMREATAKIIAATRAVGALLVFPGNVLVFGRQTDRALAEEAPFAPDTRKGRLRADLEFMIRRACDDGGMQALILRAGDFFGPGLRNGLVDRIFGRAAAGQRMMVLGRPDMPHQWAYLPDLGRLAAALLARRAALAPFQIVHFAGHVFTRQSEFLAAIAAAAGRERRRWRSVPWWLLRAGAPFDPALREMLELDYLFDDAVILDDPARRRLVPGLQPTPLPEAIAATLADYRAPRGA
jgi:nucleoside-diphosphate-sugar epimerase